jgi:NADPH:quinone reductase-like Zn-dependent oxidoreductase
VLVRLVLVLGSVWQLLSIALDYRAPDLPESLHDIDVVIDGVSAANIASIYPAMKPGSVAISLFEFTSQSLRDLMTALVGLVVAGTLEVVVSQTYPLDQAALAQEGHKRGKVVIGL